MVLIIIPFFGRYHLHLTRQHIEEQKAEQSKTTEDISNDGNTTESKKDGTVTSIQSNDTNSYRKESNADTTSIGSADVVSTSENSTTQVELMQSSRGTVSSPVPSGHVHSWQPITETISHDATGHYEARVVADAYDETTYEWVEKGIRCRDCGRIFHTELEWETFVENQCMAGDFSHGSYEIYYEQVPTTVHHDAVTSQVWIIDSPAYTETVVTGYSCSCGARK